MFSSRSNSIAVEKVGGSRRLTIRNRRFVRELDLRKTSMDDHPLETNTDPIPAPFTGKKKKMRQTASAISSYS